SGGSPGRDTRAPRPPGPPRHTDLRKVPQEPGETGRRHERASAALRSLLPRDEPAPDEAPAHGPVGDPGAGIIPSNPAPLGGEAERDTGQPDQGKPPHRLL